MTCLDDDELRPQDFCETLVTRNVFKIRMTYARDYYYYINITLLTFGKMVFNTCLVIVPKLSRLLPATPVTFHSIIGRYLIIEIKRLVYKNIKPIISTGGKLSSSERSKISIACRHETAVYQRFLVGFERYLWKITNFLACRTKIENFYIPRDI